MSHSTVTLPAGPSPATRTSDLFGEMWTRSIGVCCAAGGLLGAPLALCIGWTHGRMPHVVELAFVAMVGLLVGAIAGLPIGAAVILVMYPVLRRRPPIWRAIRAARVLGLVIGGAIGVWFGFVWSMTAVPAAVFVACALLIGRLLSPRVVRDYVDLLTESRR